MDKLTIRGFKSIRDVTNLPLGSLNVIVGANGAGKSNLISFFAMLRSLIDDKLIDYVMENGGAGDLLYNGRKVTSEIFFELIFGSHGYRVTLTPTPQNHFYLSSEARYYEHGTSGWWELSPRPDGNSEMVAEVKENKKDARFSKPIYEAITSWVVYHVHDTSHSTGMRNWENVQDHVRLRRDASNIAPFLYKLKQKYLADYKNIVDNVRLIAPFFDDFILEPQFFGGREKINLSWWQKGSDYPMQPYHLSDGTLRFIALTTALLQPHPPSTLIIDEPELGLHPAAIELLAELIQTASKWTQVIVATQSPALLDHFSIDNILVAKHKDGASIFEHLTEKEFSEWLKDYSVGELLLKNIIPGGPVYE